MISNLLFRNARHLGEDGRKISAHSLRKFHTTKLEGEMNSSWIAKLQGKSLGGGWGPYSKPEGDGERFDPEKLTEAYVRAYDVLRIKTPQSRQDKERDRKITNQEMEVEALRQRLESKETVIENLKRAQEKDRATIEDLKEKYGTPGSEDLKFSFFVRNQMQMEITADVLKQIEEKEKRKIGEID